MPFLLEFLVLSTKLGNSKTSGISSKQKKNPQQPHDPSSHEAGQVLCTRSSTSIDPSILS